MTYQPADCGSGRMWVADAGSKPLGFSRLAGDPPDGELADLFVDPIAIGTGCGRLLLDYTLRAAAARGFRRLELDADPGAESFYLHLGATRFGSSPSGSIPGRVLPRLEFAIVPDGSAT